MFVPSTGSRAPAVRFLSQQSFQHDVQVRGETLPTYYGFGIRKRAQVSLQISDGPVNELPGVRAIPVHFRARLGLFVVDACGSPVLLNRS